MSGIHNCRFCNIQFGNLKYPEADIPYASTDDFMALASIGALVEGWSLVIPKKHELSMRNFYHHSGLIEFVRDVSTTLSKQYGRIIAFEHGANREGSTTACGTDHAHLHLVPFEKSLIPEMIKGPLHWIECEPLQIQSIVGQREYLFYCDLLDDKPWESQRGYLHLLQFPISQYFRQLIANIRGKDEVSDYKLFPHLDVAINTRKTLSALFL